MSTLFATLGHAQRLAVFRLLMRRHPDRVPATEIAQALDLKPNTLSAYLAALMRAGLITQERVGTSLRYAVNMKAARGALDYLFLDCCRGRPDLCEHFTEHRPLAGKARVLFLCTGNSARSVFAEAILRRTAPDRFDVTSAGTKPHRIANRAALDVLVNHGHAIAGIAPTDVATVWAPDALPFDFVFTVCDRAANEDCPAWPGTPLAAHWGVPDPVPSGERAAFQSAYRTLEHKVTAFAALPVETLDRTALQHAIDAIGTSEIGEMA